MSDDDPNVVELEEHRPVWDGWGAVCIRCGKTWVAVVHQDHEGFLECPTCGEKAGIKTISDGQIRSVISDYMDGDR